MIRNYFLALLLMTAAAAEAQRKATVDYQESHAPILNPERGFYIPTGTKASQFNPLKVEQLRAYREQPQTLHRASYKIRFSLVYRGYELDIFKDKPLSPEFLANMQQDFDAVREAGLKMILRFAYTNSTREGDCKDDYKICPPYGDAPPEIVLGHIEQLKPLFRQNADVIAVLQEGFIGIWGENYFTDYFGDASMNGQGRIMDEGWLLRNQVLKALLDAMPQNRMVQVRTPQIKQKYVYGPSATVNSAPLSRKRAYDGSDMSRIGFHNDCFLASADDYGTFDDYGSTTQPRQPALETLRKYIMDDTRYTAVGGETCDDAFSPQNDCAPNGYAEEEMRRMHYSYLNASYNVDVINDWDSAGCFARIFNEMGYRFVLRKAQFPVATKKNRKLKLRLELENAGYASPYNPRPVKLVLKSSTTERAFDLNIDPRTLFSGKHNIARTLQLGSELPAGSYDLYLFMPDESERLAGRPEYAIQLANENLWVPELGYNKLNHKIEVK